VNFAASYPFQATAPELASVGLFYIAGRLGHRGRTERWLASYLEQLIANDGFPPPLPLYRGVGKLARKVDTITGSTRWTRAGVDAWFDGFLPPALAVAADERAALEHAATLDARAAEMAAAA